MKIKLLVVLLFVANLCYGQVNVGSSKSPLNLYSKSLKAEDFENLKKKSTCVILPEGIDQERFKNNLKDVWDVNELKFVTGEEYKKNKERILKESAILKLVGDVYLIGKKNIATGKKRSTGESITNFMSLVIYDNVIMKKGKLKYDSKMLGEIVFSPNIKMRTNVVYSGGRKSFLAKASNKKALAANKEEPGFYTFNYGYIKNFTQILNDHLKRGVSISMRDGYVDSNTIKSLKNKTLYAPEWVLKRYAPVSSTLKEVSTPEEFFEDYDYDYKIVTDDDLNAKIEAGEDIYYFLHTQYNAEKVLAIIAAKTGKYVYLETGGSYNVKGSDFKALNKAINK